MFKNRNTTIAKLVSATALVATLFAGGAHAGANPSQTVVIDMIARRAVGVLVDARYSSDTVQYIGCSLGNGGLNCAAKNSAGTALTCIAGSPSVRFLDAFKSISADTYIAFTASSTGVCTELYVTNDSRWLR